MATLEVKLELNAEETDPLRFSIADNAGNSITDLTGWSGQMLLAAGQSKTATVTLAATIDSTAFLCVLSPVDKVKLTSNGTWQFIATDTSGQPHRTHDGTFEISQKLGAG